MHWHIQPLIWPLLIATLALLAIPHPAHPQSPSLVRACAAAVGKTCHAQMMEPLSAEMRNHVGACVHERFAELPARCRAIIKLEFPKEFQQ